MQGKMLWFNERKDLGFIFTDEGERLLVRGSGFTGGKRPEGRCAQAPVSFEIDDSDGERHAREVAFVEQTAARRARRRSSGLRMR